MPDIVYVLGVTVSVVVGGKWSPLCPASNPIEEAERQLAQHVMDGMPSVVESVLQPYVFDNETLEVRRRLALLPADDEDYFGVEVGIRKQLITRLRPLNSIYAGLAAGTMYTVRRETGKLWCTHPTETTLEVSTTSSHLRTWNADGEIITPALRTTSG